MGHKGQKAKQTDNETNNLTVKSSWQTNSDQRTQVVSTDKQVSLLKSYLNRKSFSKYHRSQ